MNYLIAYLSISLLCFLFLLFLNYFLKKNKNRIRILKLALNRIEFVLIGAAFILIIGFGRSQYKTYKLESNYLKSNIKRKIFNLLDQGNNFYLFNLNAHTIFPIKFCSKSLIKIKENVYVYYSKEVLKSNIINIDNKCLIETNILMHLNKDQLNVLIDRYSNKLKDI